MIEKKKEEMQRTIESLKEQKQEWEAAIPEYYCDENLAEIELRRELIAHLEEFIDLCERRLRGSYRWWHERKQREFEEQFSDEIEDLKQRVAISGARLFHEMLIAHRV